MQTVLQNKLYIKTLFGIGFTIPYDPAQTIGEAKILCQSLSGFLAKNIRLIFAGKELQNERTFGDYKVQVESSVFLLESNKITETKFIPLP